MIRAYLTLAALLAALTLIVPPAAAQQPSPAQDPARIAAAKELFIASGQVTQFDTVINTMTIGLAGVFKKQHPSHAQEIDNVMKAMAEKFIARKSEVIDQVAPLYAERFTAEELRDIAGFYKTPVGRKLVAEQPEIMQQSMTIGMQWGRRIGQEVDKEFRRELKSRGVPI
jgi:uncharacterized protein